MRHHPTKLRQHFLQTFSGSVWRSLATTGSVWQHLISHFSSLSIPSTKQGV